MKATVVIFKPGRHLFAASQILVFGALLLVHLGAVAHPAGDNDHAAPVAAQAPAPAVLLLAAKPPTAEVPRTFKERLADYRSETFSPWSLAMPAVGAGLSQLRNYPSEWKQGGEGFGKRLASGYGSAVLENTISFGVSTFDHEDLRYPLSTYSKSAILKRAGHAFAYTFVPKKEGGGRRFGWLLDWRLRFRIHCQHLVSGKTLGRAQCSFPGKCESGRRSGNQLAKGVHPAAR